MQGACSRLPGRRVAHRQLPGAGFAPEGLVPASAGKILFTGSARSAVGGVQRLNGVRGRLTVPAPRACRFAHAVLAAPRGAISGRGGPRFAHAVLAAPRGSEVPRIRERCPRFWNGPHFGEVTRDSVRMFRTSHRWEPLTLHVRPGVHLEARFPGRITRPAG